MLKNQNIEKGEKKESYIQRDYTTQKTQVQGRLYKKILRGDDMGVDRYNAIRITSYWKNPYKVQKNQGEKNPLKIHMPKCMRIIYSGNYTNKKGYIIPNINGDKKLGIDQKCLS